MVVDRRDLLPRLARRRAAARRLDRAGARPAARGLGRADPRVRAARPTPPSCAGGGCGSRTRARSSPSTGAAPPTRRRRGPRSTRSRPRPRRPGCAPTGAARCSRSVRRCGSTRAPGSPRSWPTPTSTWRCTSAMTRPTSTRSGRSSQLAEEGTLDQAIRVGVRSDEGPSEITDEADVVVDGTDGRAGAARGAGRGLTGRASDAVLGLPAHDGPDQRRRRQRAGRASRVAGAAGDSDDLLVPFSAPAGGWSPAAIGIWLGRRAETSPPIATLLASARTQSTLPELNPARTVLNRLWPLLLSTIGAGALAFVVPQVPAVATGFAIIWALAWRRQASAVTAIEERDGARFYVERTSPLKPIQLVRTPGLPLEPVRAERGVSGAARGATRRRRAVDRSRSPTSPARPRTASTSGRCSSTPTGWRTCSRSRRRSSSPAGAGARSAAIPTLPTRSPRWGFPAGLIGGRIYFLITTPSQIPPHWWGPFAIWKGGLGIWGGIAGGVAGRALRRAQAAGPVATCCGSWTPPRPGCWSPRRSAGSATTSTRSCSASPRRCRGR